MSLTRTTRWHCLLTLFFSLLVFLPVAQGVGPDDNAQNQINLRDFFIVKAGRTHGGLDDHFDIVESWLRDTAILVNHVLAAMPADPGQVDGKDTILGRNLRAWFGLRPSKNGGMIPTHVQPYRELRRRFETVSMFLRKEHPDFTTQKPWIFYDSDWQERTELWFDGNGQPLGEDGAVINPAFRPQGNLRHLNVQRIRELDHVTESLILEMQRGTDPNWEQFVLFSRDLNDYDLINSKDYHEFGPGGVCDRVNRKPYFALTNMNMEQDTITLCPDAFTEEAEPFETIREGVVSEAATNDDLGVPLEQTSPRSLTLFHELIHLTNDPDQTPDVGTKPPACLQLIPKYSADAQRNPDSLVWFAWSHYLESVGRPSFQWTTGFKDR